MSVALDISSQSSKARDHKIRALYEEPLRRVEAEAIRQWFPPGSRVLEIGGGTGYQASIIASWECEIESIDIVSPRANPRYCPVQIYDGLHFPFGNAEFDVIYSSNVLDDIPPQRLPLIFAEMHRVLNPARSRAIHILPSTCWRLAALIGHYPALLRLAWRYLVADKKVETPREGQLQRSLAFTDPSDTASFRELIRRNLINPAQSAYSHRMAELYSFSRTHWTKLFREAHFEVIHTGGNSLFYTGHALLPTMSLKRRSQVAKLLGSACNVFVMRPAGSKT
jgi:SAM-dependent methyltransferase